MMKTSPMKIAVGEAVGIVAAQSIGEPGTQMSLAYDEKVIVDENGRINAPRIGEFADALFERFGFTSENGHEICDLPKEMQIYAPSLLSNEKVEWQKVTSVSRHKSPQKLLKISLRSGRKITATPFHSFVIRRENSIVAVAGSHLAAGERLPVVRSLSLSCASAPSKSVNAQEILATRLKYMVSNNGMLYAYPRESSKALPSQLELTGEFGWLVGIYLAEGNCTRNHTSISNTDETILGKVRSFSQAHGFTSNEYDNMRGFSLGHDIRINSRLLCEFLSATCGTSSYAKRVPDFAFGSDERFIASLLRGYFDGDGNVSVQRHVIRASSKSGELIDGICMLLARLGIFATKRPEQKTHNLSISYRYAPDFLEKIGSDIEEKRLSLEQLAAHSSKTGYNAIDVIPGIGNALLETARALGIPSRYVNSFTTRGYIGRSSLQKHLFAFEAIAAKKAVSVPQLEILRQAAESDVVWDEIESIREVAPSAEYVYDFTVPSSETFTTFDGIITHNTMRTFHYAGVAEQVPTGLPRLIELVDVRKEPKKPLMDIYLKGAAKDDEKKAQAIASDIESITLGRLGEVVEDFAQKKIIIELDADEMSHLRVEMDEVRKKVKATLGTDVETDGNILRVKPKVNSLRMLRRLTNRAKSLPIRGVERIRRCVVLKGKDGFFIRTAGSNISGIMKSDGVDSSRVYTNDIKEVEKCFGIEAARNALVHELKQVLDTQGLNVDVRHIMLLADAMTMNGQIKSIGRHGLSGQKAGVLARAAFEETVKHLVNAAISAEEDRLIGVTENIIVGQTVPLGTGLVKLKMKI